MSFLGYRVGFPDHSKPYEITVLQRNTTIEPIEVGIGTGAYYRSTTTMEINIFCKRLTRDNIDPQLGNMEREVMRLICGFNKGDIVNVSELILEKIERIYNARDTYAKAEWRTMVTVKVVSEFQVPPYSGEPSFTVMSFTPVSF